MGGGVFRQNLDVHKQGSFQIVQTWVFPGKVVQTRTRGGRGSDVLNGSPLSVIFLTGRCYWEGINDI